jgi:hypothetical protein
MADELLPDIYSAPHVFAALHEQLLVIEKINRLPATPADARRKAIAQWANLVDGLLLQLEGHVAGGARSVLAYGGVADGVTSNTAAIQAAIDAADAAGGGLVLVPLGCAQYSSLTFAAGVRMVWILDADPNSEIDGENGHVAIVLSSTAAFHIKTGGASDTGWVALDGSVTAHGSSHAAGGSDPMQVSATSRILGRVTADAGDVEELTAAQVAALVQASFDHGLIAGLTDDDHTQYLLTTGARALTGTQTTRSLAVAADSTYDIGTSTVRYRVVYADDLNVEANLTFTGAASTIFLGSATVAGNAQVRFNKGDANNQSTLRWDMGGVSQWVLQHDTSENWNLLDSSAALVLRARRGDSNLESRGIRPIADSAHDLGTTTVRWQVVYADTIDAGDGSGSPTINLNKTAAGTAYVQYRQAVGSDTDGDMRAGLNASENYVVQRRASGTYSDRFRVSSTAVVSHRGLHANGGDDAIDGPSTAADLMVGNPNGTGSGMTLWLGSGVARIEANHDGSTSWGWIETDGDGYWQWALEESVVWVMEPGNFRPNSNKAGSIGSSSARAQYLFHGTPAPDVSPVVTTGTYNLTDEGIVRVNPSGGDVTLQLPASTAANEGKTWHIIVEGTPNDITLAAFAGDLINASYTSIDLDNAGQSNGVGLYIVSVLGSDLYSCHGPLRLTPGVT